jgi:putative FmdB family regulatory protein
MPLYDFDCTQCNTRKEMFVNYEDRNDQSCDDCDTLLERQIPTPSVQVFKGGWYEHIASEPIYCETRSELSDACKRNDSISPDVENSTWLRSQKKSRSVAIAK